MRGVLAERDLPQAGRHLKGVGGGADLEAPLRTAAQPISLLTWPSLPFVNWSPQPLSSALLQSAPGSLEEPGASSHSLPPPVGMGGRASGVWCGRWVVWTRIRWFTVCFQ